MPRPLPSPELVPARRAAAMLMRAAAGGLGRHSQRQSLYIQSQRGRSCERARQARRRGAAPSGAPAAPAPTAGRGVRAETSCRLLEVTAWDPQPLRRTCLRPPDAPSWLGDARCTCAWLVDTNGDTAALHRTRRLDKTQVESENPGPNRSRDLRSPRASWRGSPSARRDRDGGGLWGFAAQA